MKTKLLASLAGGLLAATSAATPACAQDPIPVTGPFVPSYTQIPVYGFPVMPAGGGYVTPGANLPGQPLVYGYPPVGFPGQAVVPPPMMIPIVYQNMPAQLPIGPTIIEEGRPTMSGKQPAKKTGKRDDKKADNTPPEHFGPSFYQDQTDYLFRRSAASKLPEPVIVNRQ